jgi:undecaprenyl phosphate N,N'-diacetylbacillosamine 1-phosphate transferase
LYNRYLKRWFDVLFSLIALILLSPMIMIVSVALFLTNNGSIFFVQNRPGKDSKIFKILKFKTMNDTTDASGKALPDSERLTWVGKLVRKSSFDEVPQLVNVFIGKMSLIGPRPLMPEYLPLYNDDQARRHDIRPGITGWAQCNGRNSLSWHEKFEYDVYYVDNISFFLDVRIFYLTIKSVIKSDGIYKNNDVESMEAFNGKN